MYRRAAGVAIQKLLRGHFARVRAQRAAEQRSRAEADAILNHFVVMIQRIFRGFHSRRYGHSFYGRKAYIAGVQATGAALQAELSANREKQIQVRARYYFYQAMQLNYLFEEPLSMGCHCALYLPAWPHAFLKDYTPTRSQSIGRDPSLPSSVHVWDPPPTRS